MTAADTHPERLRPWLTLLHTPGIGAVTYIELLQEQPEPARLLTADADVGVDLPPRLREKLAKADLAGVERDLEWAGRPDNHILSWSDPRYPRLLRQIPDPPPLLFVHGDPDCLNQPQLAMVGSRNPSPGGIASARDFATHLARVGLTICSGLALGIDAASHQGALAGGGTTVAVMGTGLDRVYPAAHRELAHAIAAQGGALLSEFPIGTPPRRENFPRRNRIISGLSLGTLVVEAALQSGSLITARHAVEQGREVFAIPGSIHNPLARGCHALLRQGAKLVETAADILEELGPLAGCLAAELITPDPGTALQGTPTLSEEYSQLLDLMGYDPVSVDQLVDRSGLTAAAVSSMLLILELDGHVNSRAGGRYVRSDNRG